MFNAFTYLIRRPTRMRRRQSTCFFCLCVHMCALKKYTRKGIDSTFLCSTSHSFSVTSTSSSITQASDESNSKLQSNSHSPRISKNSHPPLELVNPRQLSVSSHILSRDDYYICLLVFCLLRIWFFPFPGALPFPESGPSNKFDGWAGGWRWTGFDELVWGHVCVCLFHFWTPFLPSLGTAIPFEGHCPSTVRSYPLFVGTTVLAPRRAGRSRISHLCVICSLCRAFLGVDADDSLRH